MQKRQKIRPHQDINFLLEEYILQCGKLWNAAIMTENIRMLQLQ